jgi:glycosyltransferase involved in cell wall biosynthesis
MINGKKVVVVLPAYNASKTIEMTYKEIDFSIVDDVILVDDLSKDDTVEVGKKLGIKHIIIHEKKHRLRRKPEIVLQQSTGNWRRHCGDAPPRLPIHTQTYSVHDAPHCRRSLPRGAGFAHSGQRCA